MYHLRLYNDELHLESVQLVDAIIDESARSRA
jgi:hypothetical protein